MKITLVVGVDCWRKFFHSAQYYQVDIVGTYLSALNLFVRVQGIPHQGAVECSLIPEIMNIHRYD